MHFYFLVEVLLLTTSVLKQREVPATVSSLYVSVFNTAMLRTSIAAVVLGCFYFGPLACDASVMVVDCAAVETGCMLEKYVPAKGCNKYVLIFIFWSRWCCCCFCVLLLLLPTSVLKRREVLLFSFLVAALLLLSTHREGCAEKAKVGFCFLFDTGTQSIAFSVTGYVLLLFLTAPGSCLHQS